MVHLYLAFAVKWGLSPEALCAGAGCSESQLSLVNAHVPYRWLWHIRKQVIAQLPEVPVGLELGLFCSVDQFGYMGQAVKHAATPREALVLYNDLLLMVYRGATEFPRLHEADGRVSWIMPRLPDEPAEAFHAAFTGWAAIIRVMLQRHVAPHAVFFTRCQARHLGAFEAFFEAPVQVGATHDVLVYDAAVLDTPAVQANAAASQHFRAQFERQTLPSGDALCAAVQRAIEDQVMRGVLSQARVAKQFGMTPRTLQRRCRDQGVHYRELVAAARRAAALRMLADLSMSIQEVALAVGYDASSFNRVFRRWTGLSPSAYRKGVAQSRSA